ncbi:Rad4-domain-containing protein [Dothidotthia symphoricarpi CBS 119687]|uniref:Rad4-domain-containing protein n=1 Tax=Dothidotthia symphoricarpi CBS 119687 TaxID=1392245 RepID=A0A6A6AGM3_9PLEO|nr:Rad4-domain-containing protein [Dothidotthia symphoricarpi CBS 119687]KAF2130198.1 Rad4-domain-containing protein [Dothidotthia symphoricarpi CBS 119687]
MAGARGRLHKKTTAAATPRRSSRRTKAAQQDEEVPDVYREMLYEERASKTGSVDDDSRPLKKRKTAPSQRAISPVSPPLEVEPSRDPVSTVSSPAPAPSPVKASSQLPSHTRAQATATSEVDLDEEPHTSGRVKQTIIDSDESDDSDVEWENALGDGEDSDDQDDGEDAAPEIGDISITIGGNKSIENESKRKVRRRAITSVDKKRRLDIHKMHVLCLLYHVHRRNVWCNDGRVQSALRKLVPPKTLANLVPNPDFTQYQTSKRFVEGMNELKILWSKRFKATAQGMYKPRWAEADTEARPFSDFDELDDPMDRDDFRKAAHTLRGSQDVGAQLFCALLRTIGVEARLVCSLQPLPFASAAQPTTPLKPTSHKNTIIVDPYNNRESSTPSKPKPSGPSRPKKLSRLERIMGERHPVLHNTGTAPKKQKAFHSPYPVYWVEAFNSAHQKWVPIDPLSTFTVNAPEKLEPPLSFAQNSLTYAIAFEDDYAAKDITRRYAKAYNAKTRKFRVECTSDGDKWWKRTMKFFKRSLKLDRDQVEDAALSRKEAAEGIPKSVQDFKGHPVYVLERHLRHNEVIHPLNQVGKVNCGTAMTPKMEPIYRRKDVHIVRSADKWYRLGRDVQGGEQPLKHAKPKKGRRPSISIGMPIDPDDDEQEDDLGTPLYAHFQTTLYTPPPVVNGRVPRNAYGNLDLYVPSMCPPGGTHLRHKLAAKASRIVGVDCADAVTGFSFKGRHGTAVIQGVVVAAEFSDAVQAVIEGLEYEVEAAELAARSAEAVRLWRRFFLGLRIAQRVNAMVIDGERGPGGDVQGAITREDRALAEAEMAGGFFPEDAEREFPVAFAGGFAPHAAVEHADADDAGGGGFLPESSPNPEDEDEDEEQSEPERREVHAERRVPALPREHSFESSILDAHVFRVPRRMGRGSEVVVEEDEDEDDGEDSFESDFSDGDVPLPLGDGGQSKEGGGEGIEEGMEEETGGGDGEGDVDMVDVTAPLPSPAPAPPSPPSSASASASDTNSLPLEDPEDEDADPDWLVDAT